MALIFAICPGDTAVADLASEFSTIAATFTDLTLITGVRAGSSALALLNATAGEKLQRHLPSTMSTIRFSLRIMPTAAVAAGRQSFVRLMEGATVHLSFCREVNGDLTVYRADAGTLLGTVAGFFTLNVWRWFECRAVIHDTTGAVEIRDGSGAVLLALSGIDTRNASTGVIDRIGFFNPSSSNNRVALQDVVFWSETGSGLTSWSGETRVDTLSPTGAGTTTQMTPSTGANWQCVDELPMSAADFVSSSTAGHRDLYTLSDLPFTPITVFGVIATAVGSKDDAGSCTLLLPVKSGATTSAGPGQSLEMATNRRLTRVLDTDPNTSAAWTAAAVSALEAGVEVGP